MALTDEQIEDALAEEVVAAIPAHYTPAFREALVSLYVRKMLGEEGRITTRRALADCLGISDQRVAEIESLALARLYRKHHHTLREEL